MQIHIRYAKKTEMAIVTLALSSALTLASFDAVARIMPTPSSQRTQSRLQPDAATQAKGAMNPAKLAMRMEDDDEMGGMSPGAAKSPMAPMKDGMDEKDANSGCCGMSMGKPMTKTGGMADDKMSGMPGQSTSMSEPKTADAPHLLHVGAKDFFLDRARNIGLTPEQKASLQKIKSDAMQQRLTSQKQIDVAEQELWELTSADQPDTAQIDSKVQQIAKLKGDQQMALIHCVTDATKVLNAQQKEAAVKSMATGSSPKKQKPAPMKKM
jgi:Spy/CpxP family protein refolding chaperone